MPPGAPTRRRLLLRSGGAVAAGLLAPPAGAAEPALEFTSAYNFVRVEKEGSRVTFRYAFRGARMSAVDLADPARQLVPYTRCLHAAVIFKPDPRQALMVGLGAGGFHRLFRLAQPAARLVTVEIDPLILRLAREHAGFRPGPEDPVVVDDARLFLRRARARFGWILLDAFDRAAQIPVHLATKEFFALAAARLAPDGVLLANLHQGTRFFASEVLTLRAVFSEVALLPVAGGGANVVAAATPAPAGTLQGRLRAFRDGPTAALYRAHGVDLAAIARRALVEADYLPALAGAGVVLTDDFAPAESLDAQPIPLLGRRR